MTLVRYEAFTDQEGGVALMSVMGEEEEEAAAMVVGAGLRIPT